MCAGEGLDQWMRNQLLTDHCTHLLTTGNALPLFVSSLLHLSSLPRPEASLRPARGSPLVIIDCFRGWSGAQCEDGMRYYILQAEATARA